MIRTEHGHIRTADLDDAPALLGLYDPAHPRSSLLDIRREPIMPTEDDLREMLTRKEVQQGLIHAVEDNTGSVAGFCSLRGMNHEAGFGEVAVMFLENEAYASPLADEAMAFLFERAFVRSRLRKVIAHGLDSETDLHALYARTGFETSGVQREVFYSMGRWHDLVTFSRFVG